MPQLTYQLRVKQYDPFGTNQFELLLAMPNTNSMQLVLGVAASYAACKTLAANIFVAASALTWNDTLMQTQEFYDLTTMVQAT